MLAKKYRSTVVAITSPLQGIYTVEFSSENGNYKYYPGQFLHIAIDPDFDGTSQWPDSRCFSMQSNPNDETIKITYAVKGSFTKQMEAQLKVGSEVWLKLPYGDLFTQPHNKTNTVFIAGGTGITPFLSLFTGISFANYINPVVYAGFRNRELNIYESEIESARVINPSLLFHPIYQDEQGIIDIDSIKHNTTDDTSIYISGPPVMIKLFKQSLIQKGVPAGNVLTDDWE